MGLAVLVLLAALAVGWLIGGDLTSLGRLRLRHGVLIVVGLAAQLFGALLAGRPGARWAYPTGLVVSALLIAVFLARNRGIPGTGLVALGLLANAAVVAVNGAMPVSIWATARAGASIDAVALGLDPRHELASSANRLRHWGDVVPVAVPLRPEVASPGDVLVAAGLGELVVLGMGGGLGIAGGPSLGGGGPGLRGGLGRRAPRTG